MPNQKNICTERCWCQGTRVCWCKFKANWVCSNYLFNSFLTEYHRVLKILEDEGISVAPPRRSAHPTLSTPSAIVSSAEAIPAHSGGIGSGAEAIPAHSGGIGSGAEVIPTPSTTSVLVSEDIHPQGSSRATGGILRGRAAASYYSPADEENTKFNIIGTSKLTAKIYTSNLDPLNLSHNNMVPSSKVTIKMNPNIGPILENISQRYPAIKGIYCFKDINFF